MAIYHFSYKSLKVGMGKSAIARAAYVSASKLHSERTGQTSDYTKKENVKFSELLFPDNIEKISPEKFWNQVEEKITIKGRNLGKSGDFALPIELTDEENLEAAKRFFTENFTSKGYAVQWAYHKKEGNPHIDFIIPSLKFNESGELVPPKMKSVFANAKNENGYYYDPELPSYDPKNKTETEQYRFPVIDKKTGKQKVRVRKGGEEKMWQRVDVENESLSEKSFLLQLRQSWEAIANSYLDEQHQIDCRTLEAQGIDREPQIHISPAVKAMEEKNPGSTEKMQLNNKIKEKNHIIDSYWKRWNEFQAKIDKLRSEWLAPIKERFLKLAQSRQEPHSQEKEAQSWTPTQKQIQATSKPVLPWSEAQKNLKKATKVISRSVPEDPEKDENKDSR